MAKRYVIETNTLKADALVQKFIQSSGGSVKVIDKYDSIQNITAEVQRVGQLLKEFKATGVSWNVFNSYLRGKGLSQKMIDAVMQEQKQFFRDLGIDMK